MLPLSLRTAQARLSPALTPYATSHRQGFSPIGKLKDAAGVAVFSACHDCSSYVKLDQSRAKEIGNAYFEEKAPKLSYIKSATLV